MLGKSGPRILQKEKNCGGVRRARTMQFACRRPRPTAAPPPSASALAFMLPSAKAASYGPRAPARVHFPIGDRSKCLDRMDRLRQMYVWESLPRPTTYFLA